MRDTCHMLTNIPTSNICYIVLLTATNRDPSLFQESAEIV